MTERRKKDVALVARFDIFPGAIVFAEPDAQGISEEKLRDLASDQGEEAEDDLD